MDTTSTPRGQRVVQHYRSGLAEPVQGRYMLGLCIWILCTLLISPAYAQRADLVKYPDRARYQPVIEQVHGARVLPAHTPTNYRVRLRRAATQPVEYRWDFGDGHLLEGPMLTYRFDTPGDHTITVTTRNAHGADTTTFTVRVMETAEQSAERTTFPALDDKMSVAAESTDDSASGAKLTSTALASASRSNTDEKGTKAPAYTWVIATHLSRFPAEIDVQMHRTSGYSSQLRVDSNGRGSPAYRVCIGQYATIERALAARHLLPGAMQTTAWLLDLADAPAPQTPSRGNDP